MLPTLFLPQRNHIGDGVGPKQGRKHLDTRQGSLNARAAIPIQQCWVQGGWMLQWERPPGHCLPP